VCGNRVGFCTAGQLIVYAAGLVRLAKSDNHSCPGWGGPRFSTVVQGRFHGPAVTGLGIYAASGAVWTAKVQCNIAGYCHCIIPFSRSAIVISRVCHTLPSSTLVYLSCKTSYTTRTTLAVASTPSAKYRTVTVSPSLTFSRGAMSRYSSVCSSGMNDALMDTTGVVSWLVSI